MICRVCDSSRLELAIDLGQQPWCNHFLRKEEVGREPFYPLHLVFCHDCHTVQLDHTVPKETMFGDHTYLSGVTRSLDEHFRRVADLVDSRFPIQEPGKAVLDIGSNDGTQLKHFQRLGYDVLGVESSRTVAGLASAAGVPTVNRFFNLELARSLQRKFDVINAAGVFFHLEELHSVTEGIREVLKPGGVFVVQFLYMNRIVENCAFDQIYHEHLLYYNLNTIEILLNRHGLSMFDAQLEPIHGGSIVGFVGHQGSRECTPRLEAMRQREVESRSNEIQTYLEFAQRIAQMKQENLAFLGKAREMGKTVFGMGAPVKGNTLLNYFGVDGRYIKYLVERNTLRRGLYAPGSHIPVLIEDELTEVPDIYYVLAWNFKDEILQRHQPLREQGVEFFFPVDPDKSGVQKPSSP